MAFVGCYCLFDLMSVGYLWFLLFVWVCGLRCLVWVWMVLVCALVVLSVTWLVAGALFDLFACIVCWLHMVVCFAY